MLDLLSSFFVAKNMLLKTKKNIVFSVRTLKTIVYNINPQSVGSRLQVLVIVICKESLKKISELKMENS